MARPAKNCVDYFSHDAGMRDHKKVKAIRTKFGLVGYGLWVMLLEHLSGSDGNVFEYSDMEFELMSGDFGVSATEIRSVVDYCIGLEMLFIHEGFVNSPSLDERLAPVYTKRGAAKELSQKQKRKNGKFCSSKSDETVVSVTEMPQSKVKESKVNESEYYPTRKVAFDELSSNYLDMEPSRIACSSRGWRTVADQDIHALLFYFINAKADISTPKTNIRNHFKNWLNREPIDKLIELSKSVATGARQATEVSRHEPNLQESG